MEAVSYTVGETSYKAELSAIKNCTKNGLTISDAEGRVYATVCVVKDGEYYNGSTVKYTSIQTFYLESGHDLKDAICRGRIVQL